MRGRYLWQGRGATEHKPGMSIPVEYAIPYGLRGSQRRPPPSPRKTYTSGSWALYTGIGALVWYLLPCHDNAAGSSRRSWAVFVGMSAIMMHMLALVLQPSNGSSYEELETRLRNLESEMARKLSTMTTSPDDQRNWRLRHLGGLDGQTRSEFSVRTTPRHSGLDWRLRHWEGLEGGWDQGRWRVVSRQGTDGLLQGVDGGWAWVVDAPWLCVRVARGMMEDVRRAQVICLLFHPAACSWPQCSDVAATSQPSQHTVLPLTPVSLCSSEWFIILNDRARVPQLHSSLSACITEQHRAHHRVYQPSCRYIESRTRYLPSRPQPRKEHHPTHGKHCMSDALFVQLSCINYLFITVVGFYLLLLCCGINYGRPFASVLSVYFVLLICASALTLAVAWIA